MAHEQSALRMLLVENDPEDAFIFRRYAQNLPESVVVDVASNVAEALELLASRPYDLLFADLDLGAGEDGITLVDRLRQSDLGVPAIMVTGSGSEARAVSAMKAGAYDYLAKNDLSPDLLARTIRNACNRLALERERERMTEKLVELSTTDELTGLPNRRLLTQRIEQEAARTRRTGRPFGLLMIDLDHFKEVNDRYGHQTGDDVLRQCAECLRRTLREVDFVARYGGEEFCAVLPESSAEGAVVVAEKLRAVCEALPEPVPTISIGVAIWRNHETAEGLVQEADVALYRAKETGRNRVVAGGPPQSADATDPVEGE